GLIELRLHSPREGALRMSRADSPLGPYRPLPQAQPIRRGANRLRLALPESDKGYYRLQW
ncbi:MAG: TIGR03790 family protein, partial [Rhodocyclaceae bacterium]|nr:TIGR03790 family protein [Rhodocyclaceae bacterium]